MIIDFDNIANEVILGFKGGEGELHTRNFADSKVKIMKSVLKPGASSGIHMHQGNCEIVYILKGTATFYYDDAKEKATEGQVHYCPMNHRHYMVNETDEDLEYFAVVPEHH